MIERKKFFGTVGLGFLGFLFAGFSPLKVFLKNRNATKRVDVKINSLAVKRTKMGGRNV
ncbi:hypothetical protein ACFLSS_01100 [Bacteroidota bacterium]